MRSAYGRYRDSMGDALFRREASSKQDLAARTAVAFSAGVIVGALAMWLIKRK